MWLQKKILHLHSKFYLAEAKTLKPTNLKDKNIHCTAYDGYLVWTEIKVLTLEAEDNNV